MTDCNLRFVVTIPIHMEAMIVRRKVREHPHNREPAKNIYKIGKLEEGNPNQKKCKSRAMPCLHEHCRGAAFTRWKSSKTEL